MKEIKVRNSNLELLRIISMVLIIAHHYSIYGFLSVEMEKITFNKYLIDILAQGGKIGVSCFILISGYFMINNKFTIKKLWKIIGEVLFYSYGIIILFITILQPMNKIDFQDILSSVLPIANSLYWFVTCYILLMIISPYLNKFVKNLTKIELRNFIIIMLILWSIYKPITRTDLEYSDLGWFIVLYCISAYINLYVGQNIKNRNRNRKNLFISIILLILSVISLNVFAQITGINFYIRKIKYIGSLNNILI